MTVGPVLADARQQGRGPGMEQDVVAHAQVQELQPEAIPGRHLELNHLKLSFEPRFHDL